MLQDADGNRFTPSHTLKNGKRYRYYVCQATMDGDEALSKPARLPAHDVERQIALRLRSFLQSTKDLMDELSQPEDRPALTQQLIAAASKRSDLWFSASPAEVQDFVRKVVRRVVVHPDRIEVEVSKRELRSALTACTRRALNAQMVHGPGDVIRLEVEAQVRRRGGEMRLVLPPDPAAQTHSHPVSSLLRALARGHEWYGWIVAGDALSQRSIAQKLGLNERYVGRVLECAFLAPDIVEAILDGRQPSYLTFEKLTRGLPLSWVEQRKQLGFPPLQYQTNR